MHPGRDYQVYEKNMAVGADGGNQRSLEQTPTWAVVVVCSAFVLISVIIEKAVHHVGTWLYRREKKALYEAVEILKSELMLMGFISLLLTVGQAPISKICIPKKIAYSMLPCEKEDTADSGSDSCSKKGKYPLVSLSGMTQLHLFIFTLAVLHALFSILTIALARAKMRRWKAWEKEIQTLDYQLSHDPARFRLAQQTLFVKRQMNFWSRTPILKWVVCFFRQFFRSIRKVDYQTLRHGFIIAHLSENNKFDFHKYIKSSMADDFKRVIGISAPLWAFAMLFLLLNVYNWHAYFWLSFAPLIIILIVGTKLQIIILEMALEIEGSQVVVKGTPVVQPTDKLFWLGRPQLVISLIHFTFFENAFQLAFLLWIWWQFGLRSCFHERFYTIILRIIIGVIVQFICSYVTLPLYALVTQMGSQMRKPISQQQIATALKRWKQKAKKTPKINRNSNSGLRSGPTPSHGSSPLPLLRRYDTTGDIESQEASPSCYNSQYELSDLEMDVQDNPQSTIQHSISNPVESTSNLELVASSSYPQSAVQHSISNPVETSNVDLVASSSYPGKPTKAVSINTDTPRNEATREQHSISKHTQFSQNSSFRYFHITPEIN